MTYEHPDRDRCLMYLRGYESPDRVVGHCKAVADAACRIGKALNEAGGTLAPPISEVTFESFERDGGRIDRSDSSA